MSGTTLSSTPPTPHTAPTAPTAAAAAAMAPTRAAPALQALDGLLPVALTGSGHGWFTRYRRYPVFSASWARQRSLAFGLLTLVLLCTAALPLMFAEAPAQWPLGAFAQLGLQLIVPLLLGPWLGTWVRRRGWPETREYAGLVGAVALTVIGMLAFHQYGAEAMKQLIAEAVGAVDENGKRKRVALSIGMMVSSPDDAASAPSPAPPPDADRLSPMARFSNGLSSAVVSFWLAGGMALWGWRRERSSLAALARERELERAQIQRREAELKLSVLAAQVEPHFLFNTLAGVRSAIATDPGRASEMIDRLVDYLRAAIPRLRSSGGSEATLGGQLEIVRAYLGLMKARMPRLSFSIEAGTALLSAPFPSLMLISLAENAVKHGVEPKVGLVRIEVHARRNTAGRLEVTLTDDGAGFGAGASGSGLGLSNIRERLRQMYGDGATLTLRNGPHGGVAATLTLPPEMPCKPPHAGV